MKPSLKDTYDSCKEIDSISNKRNVDPEILKAYINVYSFLYKKISDETVIPKLSNSDIVEIWISNRNWLMIPPKGCSNREDSKKSPYPNIWIEVSDDLEYMNCGLHWAQVSSVDNFLNLLDPLNYKLIKKLKEVFITLKKDCVIITQTKTHKKGLAPAAPSEFKEVKRWKLKEFDAISADEILKSADEIRKEGKQLREFGEVEWCVPTIQIEYKKFKADDYEQLLEIVMDYIKVLKVCHGTLTQSQTRKIKHSLKKDFDYERLKKQYKELKILLEFKRIKKEDFTERINEFNEKIKEYNLAFNKNLDLLE